MVAIARNPEKSYHLTQGEADALATACGAAIESVDPKLDEDSLNAIELLVGELRKKARR